VAFNDCLLRVPLPFVGYFVFVLADKIIYWVKIAGQETKHFDFF